MISAKSFSRLRLSKPLLAFMTSPLWLALSACDLPPPNATLTEIDGVVVYMCNVGYLDCDSAFTNGCEVDLNNDESNCGSCGVTCASPHVCWSGICGFNNTNCPGINLATNEDNCGTCGNKVDDGNVCTIDSCVGGVPVHVPLAMGAFCPNGVCNSNGQCAQYDGTACSTDVQCKSGFCTDGVCCDKACNGTCESCKQVDTGAPNGQCKPVPSFTDPGDECPNGVCIGLGQCSDPGIACTMPSDCASGFCVDGYCCDSPCTETCMACNVPNNFGICTPLPIYEEDIDASTPCSGPTLSCNGNGVCKGYLGQTCSSDDDCLSGACDAGLCSMAMPKLGPLAWEWYEESASYANDYNGYTYGDLNVSEMVAMNDGRTRAVGTFMASIFGMPSDGYDEMWGNTTAYVHNYLGPHLFVFDLDANAQTGTFGKMFDGINLLDKLSFYEYERNRTYSKGLQLWLAGGNGGVYFEGWREGSNDKLGTGFSNCYTGRFAVSPPSSWSLGGAGACALQAWTIAGDSVGNTFARSAAGISHYDQAGQLQQVLPDPFSGPEGKLAIGPQGEFHLGARDTSVIRLAKADAAGTLQWTKNIPAPVNKGQNDCFSYALDTAGNILLAFHGQGVVDFGQGPLLPRGLQDFILAKLDPQGNPIWTKRFGGPNFQVKTCSLRGTGPADLAVLLDSSGTVDLGKGVLVSSPVLLDFDPSGTLRWQSDMTNHFPFVVKKQTWALSGHPSGAVFVSGSGSPPLPASSSAPLIIRFVVAKYGP